ncbi:MAG TPA: hypothetical protein VMS64_23135, partial [Candidatus Methylomirabilis sp.]|nr:hypothetical protein [Candidatus Methylomirabilis sp.]
LQPFPLLGRLAAEAGSSPGASQKATLHAIQSLGERVLPALRDTDPTVSDGVSAAAWPAGKSRGVGAAGSDHRAGRSS